MSVLNIESTKETPNIHFDAQKSAFMISGNSLPENAAIFYKPVYDWVTNYIQDHDRGFELIVDLNYLNSSSVKFIFAIFMKINEAHKNKIEDSGYKITWKYKAEDELMKQKGEEFKSFLEVPFELNSY